MAAQPETPQSDKSPARTRPIELLTENGFIILRPWEIDGVPPPVTGKYSFLVRSPHEERERQVLVEVADRVVTQIERYSRGRIVLCSSFWVCCAERHLATYVWENDDYPPDGKLNVDQLTPEDLDQATRWGTTGSLLT